MGSMLMQSLFALAMTGESPYCEKAVSSIIALPTVFRHFSKGEKAAEKEKCKKTNGKYGASWLSRMKLIGRTLSCRRGCVLLYTSFCYGFWRAGLVY